MALSVSVMMQVILLLFNALSMNAIAADDSWDFGYTGSVQEFTAPYTGKYKLDIYGGKGGGVLGKGGYTTGYINLYAGDKLYIAVGGKGVVSSSTGSAEGGWNGGGKGYYGAGSGAGATSVTTTLIGDGQLKNYENNKSEVVAVAGGGGGKGSNQNFNSPQYASYDSNETTGDNLNPGYFAEYIKSAGCGGGLTCDVPVTNNGNRTTGVLHRAKTYKFGIGEDGSTTYLDGYAGAGGGGYTGGGINYGEEDAKRKEPIGILNGMGGYGYINNSYMYDADSIRDVNDSDGKAVIKYEGKVYTKLILDLGEDGTIDGKSGIVEIEKEAETIINIPSVTLKDNYRLYGWKLIYGEYDDSEQYEFTFKNTKLEAIYIAPLAIKIDKIGLKYKLEWTQNDKFKKDYKVEHKYADKDWEQVKSNRTQTDRYIANQIYPGCTNSVKEFTAPASGYYKLQAVGASGGGCRLTNTGWWGMGGYTYGNYFLKKGETIYFCIGGVGGNNQVCNGPSAVYGRPGLPCGVGYGGYNGGGNGYGNGCAGGGGGATSITKTNRGVLANFSSYRDEVILVAGGCGGSNGGSRTGYGGGLQGGSDHWGGTGATQVSGYSFGKGGNAPTGYESNRGGGGGGWYGGYSCSMDAGAGRGGSGYINPDVISGETIGNIRESKYKSVIPSGKMDGYGSVELVDFITTGSFVDDLDLTDTKAPNKASDGTLGGKDNKLLISWKDNGDNGENIKFRVSSFNQDNGELLNESSEYDFEYISGVKGFYYKITDKTTQSLTVTNLNGTFIDKSELQIEHSAETRYMHIAVVDNAGNISDTYSFEIPGAVIVQYLPNNTAKNVYDDNSTTSVTGQINNDIVVSGTTWKCKENIDNSEINDIAYKKKGYEFAGWNLEPNAKIDGSSIGENGKKYTGTFIPVGTELTYEELLDTYGFNVNLYAIWEPIRYNLKIHGNNPWNNEPDKEIELRYDHPEPIPPNTFERKPGQPWDNPDKPEEQGYEFIGWGYTPDQHEPDFHDKEEVVNLADKEGDTVDIYVLWRKDLVLTFNLNGGIYKNSKDSISLTASVYNSQKEFTFDVIGGITPSNLPKWTEQQGKIDAYGTWNSNGINSEHTKTDKEGNQYRFLGWSLDKNASVPDAGWIVFDTGGRNKKYSIKHSTTLYAVWEPILVADITFKRVLGDNTFKDGTHPVSRTGNLTADMPLQKIEAIMTAGEQGEYNIIAKGAKEKNALIYFDDAITQIYNNGSDKQYYDKLNPPTSENMETDQKHGLNRSIFTDKAGSTITRKFYVPQYLGTDRSYPGNNGVNQYRVDFIVSQHSFFYETVHNKPETIKVQAVLHLLDSGKSVLPGPEPTPTPDGGGGEENPDNPGGEGGDGDKNESTTITEFRTNILD